MPFTLAIPQMMTEPTDEEIMELMPQQMHDDLAAAARALAGDMPWPDNPKAAVAMRIILNRHAVDHARAVLARWGNSQAILDSSPQPVPVSEGLPRPDDCDDEGYCWWWRTDEVGEWWEFLYLRDARDHNRRCGSARYTHWLPYHTIPNLPNPND